MNKITIAIDGFSSTGKSTVAKQIAKHLGYVYVDSGAMYRAITYFAMQNGIIGENYFKVEDLIAQLPNVNLHFEFNEQLGFAEVYLNGINIEKEIRTLEVSRFVSKVATVSQVREQLVKQQKKTRSKQRCSYGWSGYRNCCFSRCRAQDFYGRFRGKKSNQTLQRTIG